jgi:glycosyltransferase involved in cell wall biosynthesis
MPKVSVVIPCFNQGSYLDEAVDSVLLQTWHDFEIIIVNDGSTDECTNRLLESYNRPRTRVISTANQGLAQARNTGIAAAHGKYILPLDADDRIGREYLEKAISVLDSQPNMGIVYCLAEKFGAQNGPWNSPDYSLRRMLLGNLIFCSALFRREDWEHTGGYKQEMKAGWEDWDFWLSLLELGRDVYRIPDTLFFYRVKDVSMATSMDVEKKVEMHLQIIRNHPSLFIEKARPLLTLYYRITGSRPYRILKQLRMPAFIDRALNLPKKDRNARKP